MCYKRCFGKQTTFIIMMVLKTGFFFVEIIVGYITNSMALVADSFHMLSDILSLFIGFFALKFSKKSPGKDNISNTFGLARAEVLGALANAVFLLALCFSMFVQSLKRIAETASINDPDLVLIVGSARLLVDLIGLFMFQGHAGHGHSHGGGSHGSNDKRTDSHEHKNGLKLKGHVKDHMHANGVSNGHLVDSYEKKNGCENKGFKQGKDDNVKSIVTNNNESTVITLGNETEEQLGYELKEDLASTVKSKEKDGGHLNIKGVYLHILGDALGSVIVIIAALVVKYFDGKWTDYVDPAMSILIVLIIFKTTMPLLRESSKILLQHVPKHIQVKKLKEKIQEKFPEVSNIHEFHIWQLTGSIIIASAHVRVPSSIDYNVFSAAIKDFFHLEGIHSTTIQPEFVEDTTKETEKQCLVRCNSNTCGEKLCCGQSKSKNKSNIV